MGKNDDHFESHISKIVKKHFKKLTLTQKPSKNSKYLALSVTVHTTSQAQLDDLYRALSSDKSVVMVL